MKRVPIGLALLLLAGLGRADPTWFTIVGNPVDPAADTIQVEVASIQGDDALRTAKIRVSRANVRLSPWAKVEFRSFVALTQFDCKARTARYLATDFHRQPLWQGTPFHSVTYPRDVVATMRFRDVDPNPAERIVRAACELRSVAKASSAATPTPPATSPAAPR